ncbi:MAG TPA: 50S ribosomal protein L11 [Candidatus Diapherotrites archaeon]|uniref:Large ribosomal subunit protein uL11 n=1 Tax=Candidatus Iainarchaeum sp. TaxID=3101447 RepID=A0A7J4J233_9ARCH|nr:50S ribosomal protein L11 [Candidatus Diapherotrites archaeon]
MAEISALVEGGKATAGAPLGPALGPLGVNIGKIVAEINDKTKGYAGMKVPVTIEVDKQKNITITVGSPPTSALITKEIRAQKGGANQRADTVGNLSMAQVKKLAEAKIEALTSTDLYSASREIIGTCNSMAVTIEGKRAKEVQQEFRDGKWDEFFGVKKAHAQKAK